MKQLALYLPCCYPNEHQFFSILDIMEKYHVDVLELGIPVANAHMDGKIIQNSHKQVLQQGFNKVYLNKILQQIREKYSFKIVLMTYKDGLDKYHLLDEEMDYDGLLCVDRMITLNDFPSPIQLYNENISNITLQEKLKNNRLFAYCMSGVGKTGSFDHVPTNYIETMQRIRKHSDLPIYVGFGIKERKDVAEVFKNGADGAIIGSYFVNKVKTSTLEEVAAYIKDLKSID
ncbi:tryptophan synthase subunit alpha [Cerasibacillus sp. JNUCC 74]